MEQAKKKLKNKLIGLLICTIIIVIIIAISQYLEKFKPIRGDFPPRNPNEMVCMLDVDENIKEC